MLKSPKQENKSYWFAGVAVGGGWQGLVAYINMSCYYVIGLPLGYLLGYNAKLGVQVRIYYALNARSTSSTG